MKRMLPIASLIVVAGLTLWQLMGSRGGELGHRIPLPVRNPAFTATGQLFPSTGCAPVPLVSERVKVDGLDRPTIQGPTAHAHDRTAGPGTGVPLSGLLIVPPEWNARPYLLELQPVQVDGNHDGARHSQRFERRELVEVAPGQGCYRFRRLNVGPGRYELHVHPFAHREWLDIGPNGLPNAVVQLGVPRRIQLRCVEAGSGRSLGTDEVSVTWKAEDGGVSQLGRFGFAHWDEALGCWYLMVPDEPVVVEGVGMAFLSNRIRVGAELPSSEVLLEVRPACELRIVLRDRGVTVRWETGFPSLFPLEGQPDYRSEGFREGNPLLRKQAPGLYRLELPTIPGFQPVSATVIELDVGVREHVVELVRVP